MRTILLLGVMLGAAFMMGWFQVSRNGDQTTISIDKSKIRSDVAKVRDNAREQSNRQSYPPGYGDFQTQQPNYAQPGFASQPPYGPQPNYGTQQNYGSQPSYSSQPNYGQPVNYGQQPNYGAPTNYISQPGYGTQPGYYTPQPNYGTTPVQGASYNTQSPTRTSGSQSAPWDQTR